MAADAQNIGFAIPINEAKGIIESAKTGGKVSRAYLGVQYVMLSEGVAEELGISQTQGAYVSADPGSVISGSPAEKAGIKAGDVVTRVGSTTLNEKTSLASAIGRLKAGETVELTIIRDGKEQKVSVTLTEAPAS